MIWLLAASMTFGLNSTKYVLYDFSAQTLYPMIAFNIYLLYCCGNAQGKVNIIYFMSMEVYI